MHTGIYFQLALQSMKKNYRISLPFFGGSVIMCAMFYSIASLAYNPNLGEIFGGEMMNSIMGMGERVIMLFTLIFYFYLNSVWFKNRKQENGLFTILGMEKSHLIRIQIYQLLLFLLGTLVCGIVLGICLDKIMFMLILKLSGMKPAFGFYISHQGMTDTVLWMSLCYGLILVWSVFMTLRTNPLEQLHGSQTGEKKIKNRWILAVLGVLFLGSGYGLALWVKDPLNAMVFFFVAVILVIIGTYLIFMFGSTVLVQILQKNKNYYYKPNHFISVSTMKYRLKQNAAALANISILSTMVLVTLSTTMSLIAGVDTVVNRQYPRDYTVQLSPSSESVAAFPSSDGQAALQTEKGALNTQQLSDELQAAAETLGLHPEDVLVYLERPINFIAPEGVLEGNQLVYATAIDLQDFNRITGRNDSLAPGEMIAIGDLLKPGMTVRSEKDPSKTYTVKESIETLPDDFSTLENVVMPNTSTIVMDLSQEPDNLSALMLFNEAGTGNRDQEILDTLTKQGLPVLRVNWKIDAKQEFLSVYSGVLFVGIYLSALFILAVILIMYYKQISEGLEDQKRFAIMQNVGLEPKQIRQVINDQVLLLFFLPLGMALIHLLFAYPMIEKIMRMLQMGYTGVFLSVTAICFVTFALIYVIIYRLTARTYYRLTCVSDKN